MSRVITFSTTFPAYHPKAGNPTLFPYKIWKSLGMKLSKDIYPKFVNDEFCMRSLNKGHNYYKICDMLTEAMHRQDFEMPKHHTIRAGNRWKAGDKFSPRIWSGKPYNSTQIIISPDIEIKKVWDIKIDGFCFWIKEPTQKVYNWLRTRDVIRLAENDGLILKDLCGWFKAPCQFQGQIICWNDKVEY